MTIVIIFTEIMMQWYKHVKKLPPKILYEHFTILSYITHELDTAQSK